MADRNSLPRRVQRYARVSTAMGGLAARLAGKRYLGLKLDQTRHAADLKSALGNIKGPLMKVAQLLATLPDALPEEYAAELAGLQSNAPPMGWPFVKRRMASELGPDWLKKFKSFTPEAAHAASLGQVHHATGFDGKELACKLQYPDMASAVEADLMQLKLVLALFERYDRSISTADIQQEIGARLREELDYRREASHMRLFGAMLAKEDEVQVPEYVETLSTGRLLTMTWLDGRPFVEAAADGSLAARNAIARNMFRAWYVPLYFYGVIHGDPHLGNYTIRRDSGVNLLDYGCIRIFPPSFVRGVIDLYHALDREDEELAVSAYEIWGFNNLSREMIATLNNWARYVYAPLLDDRKRRIQEHGSSTYGREVAETVHRDIRRLGGVKPPREFVFMDRAAVGLGSVFLRLKAEINWHRMFHELIDDFDEKKLAARQKKALEAAGVKASTPS
ncbi:MAG TPA: AarF/ABC1/UbiB kinase family protein [Stellaceae bacterium]|nr:AarF/ABC1/UbiB kinase family protein [Stellaceae bacterium]